jgi:ketosteroid isomerase-like protein
VKYPVVCGALLLAMAIPMLMAQSNAEDEVRKAMADKTAAIVHKDAAALNRLYADDYYRISDTGRVMGKADFIKRVMDPSNQEKKVDLSDVKIRVYGDVAVVTGLGAGTFTSKRTPEVHRGPEERFLAVWVKHNGAWQKTVGSYTSTVQVPSDIYQR